MYRLVILLILTISLNSFSLEENKSPEKFLVIKPFDNKVVSELESDQINKSMLMIVTKQQEYQLLLSDIGSFSGIKTNIYSVATYIYKKPEGYKIKTVLKNMKSSREIKAIKYEKVSKQNLLRKVTISLELLFFDDRNDNLRKKKDLNESVRGGAVKTDPNRGIKAFKNRIKNLKASLANNFKKVEEIISTEEENKDKQNEDDGENNKNKNSNSLGKISSHKRKNKKNKPVSASYGGYSEIWVGYTGHSVEAREDIEDSDVQLITETNVPYLGFGYFKGFFLNKKKTVLADTGIQYGQTYADFEQEIGKYILIRGGLLLKLTHASVLGVHFERESLNFTNLPAAGEGIQASNNQIIWIKPIFSYTFEELYFPIRLGASYGILSSSTSDYETINNNGGFSSGSLMSLEVIIDKIYMGFGLKFDYEKVSMVSTGDKDVEADSTGIGAYLVYIF